MSKNNKHFKLIVFLLILIQIINCDPVRVPWAQQWSQNFQTHSSQSNTWSNGSVYYSWKTKSYKTKFERAVYSPCSAFGAYLTQCSYLILNKDFYVYFPAKSICNRFQINNFPPQNQTVLTTQYHNTTTIQKIDYYVWRYTFARNYYLFTRTDQKQINYWEYQYSVSSSYSQNQYHYLENSYSQNVDQKVFQLPQFCKNATLNIDLNQQQQLSLQKYLNTKFIKDIKTSLKKQEQ